MAVIERTRMARPDTESGQRQDQMNVGDMERWISTIGGGALALYALSRPSMKGKALAAVGGTLMYRGISGHCPAYGAAGISTAGPRVIDVHGVLTVNRPPMEAYRAWRNLENLPRFMEHLQSVEVIDNRRSHWVVSAPAGQTVEWDAEILEDVEGQRIRWRSVEGSGIDTDGEVLFREAPGGRGTVVEVHMSYVPPGGLLGAGIAKLFGEEPKVQTADDLRRFKSFVEAGEIPTNKGQSSGRPSDS